MRKREKSEFLSSFNVEEKKRKNFNNKNFLLPADVQRQRHEVRQVLPEDEGCHLGLVEAEHRRDGLHVDRRRGDALEELLLSFFF